MDTPCRVDGNIPTDLAQLSELQYLSIIGSGVTGNIPSELAQLSNLTLLQIAATSVTGSIPAEFGGMDSLSQMHTRMNPGLTGTIPAELFAVGTELSTIDLQDNSLSGELPSSVVDWSNYHTELNGWTLGLAGNGCFIATGLTATFLNSSVDSWNDGC